MEFLGGEFINGKFLVLYYDIWYEFGVLFYELLYINI